MRGILLAVLTSLVVLSAWSVHAEETVTSCEFQIGYSSWREPQCTVEDKGGTLAVRWSGGGTSIYLVRLNVTADRAHAEAAWSGFGGGADPTEPLGMLSKEGNCWSNETARLCYVLKENGGPENTASARESELDTYYPCAAHRSLEEKERLNDYANATKNDPCTVTSSRREIDELATQLEIAQEVQGDEEEAERANEAAGHGGSNSALTTAEADAAPGNASSFRGLTLGMNAKQLSDALPAELSLFNQRRRPSGDKGIEEMNLVMTLIEAQAPNGVPLGSLFILDSNGRLCGELSFANGRTDKMRLHQCYFGISKKMSLEDFAQQVNDNYQLEEGMAYDMRFFGSGMNRIQYFEYAGVRRATSERFTAAINSASNVLTLTVERIDSVNFN